jgi:2-keto-4-pentenoate hydratase/2-oxohepta-3-ene-1,7-dioic acid hydratase in catechol pathway
MKFISYKLGADGAETWGLVREDGVVDLAARGPHKTMRDAIAAGELMSLGEAGMSGDPDTVLPDVTFLPVITNPDKILCAGLNYKDHVSETNNTLPAELQLFMRSTNTLVGHCGEMERPKVSDNYDFEGELTAIIGKGGRHISEADALDHVAGYTIFIDGSVRDYQKHSVTAGKNFYKSGPLGPWMVSADEIPDPTTMELTTRLNGEVVQHSTTDMLIFSVPYIISYISRFTPLEPGDVIATGTPSGVGARRTPPLWMKAGDRIEVNFSKIGTLWADVVDEA